MQFKNKFFSLRYYGYALCAAALMLTGGCNKYLDIPLPVEQIAGSGAFTTDKSSAAVVNNIFAQFYSVPTFDGTAINFNTGLYSDELQSIGSASSADRVFYQNKITAANTGNTWIFFYKQIYNTNLAIEGLTASGTLTYKNQWLGEAYFLRALCYLLIADVYGDGVLAVSSDYYANRDLPRVKVDSLTAQSIRDLLQAQSLLSDEYKGVNGLSAADQDRARPNKAAATAMLARVYLYAKDWANAEAQASKVIAKTDIYALTLPSQTFLKNSKETIWGLAPTSSSGAPVSFNIVRDYTTYNNTMPDILPAGINFPASSVNVALSDTLLSAFEPGDKRFAEWTRLVKDTVPVLSYRFPNKYRSKVNGEEYVVVLRLAEQYLIRAEARARQNKLTGPGSAKEDLDAVRSRAGLTGTTATANADNLADAIINERKVELFTEGHRLIDLRRTGKLDALMTVLTPKKGGTKWESFMQYWPIRTEDQIPNPGIYQTPGYQ